VRLGRAFTARRDGSVGASLASRQAYLLRRLGADLLTLLAEGDVALPTDPLEAAVASAPRVRPDDPALLRLLPDAVRSDLPGSAETAAAQRLSQEFRRLSEGDLRAGKRADAQTLLDTLGDAVLPPATAASWLRSINDARLVLGSRLELRTDEDLERLWAEHEVGSQASVRDPVVALIVTYDELGGLQEDLVRAVERLG